MDKKLENIDKKLSELQRDFDKQLHAIEDDVNEFHKQLINLGVQHPNSKELIEFIVFINDRIETKQSQFEDVLRETIKSLIDYKKELIDINTKVIIKVNDLEAAAQPKSFLKLAFSKIKGLADIKIIFGFITLLSFMAMKIFWPEASDEFIKYLLSLFL